MNRVAEMNDCISPASLRGHILTVCYSLLPLQNMADGESHVSTSEDKDKKQDMEKHSDRHGLQC